MSFGRLASHKSGAAGTFVVYEVPVGKFAEMNITVVNNSGTTANVILFISPTPTPAADFTIQNDMLTVTGVGYERRALVAVAGECVCYKTDQIGVNVVVNGQVSNTTGITTKTTTLITTNTDTTVFANVAAKDTVVDITTLLTEGTNSDTCVTELYITTTNVAGGFLIQKESLRMTGTVGFEKGGLPISAADKLILRTTGIVGQVAVRVVGFTTGV